MNVPASSEDQAPSAKRRTLVAGLGVGICASALGLWNWSKDRSASTAESAKTPAAPSKARHADASVSPAEEVASSSVGTGEFSRSRFAPHLNTNFRSDLGTLKMIQVSPEQHSIDERSKTAYVAFSLLFEGARDMRSESQICHLTHDSLGEMEVFLSPVGHYEDKVRYEAVFSQKV